MTAPADTATAGGVQLVDTPGRPARSVDSKRGEHDAESVLSLNTGAGPKQFEEDCMAQCRPARPVGYWERIDRIVDAAPPLTDDQRARIRAAFHQSEVRRAAA